MNRRRFLRGAGGAAIALPFFNTFGAGEARAAAGAPKRFFAFMVDHSESPDMLPTGPGPGLDLRNTYFDGLQEYADRSLIVSNLYSIGGHGSGVAGALTGKPTGLVDNMATGGPSLDVMFGDRWTDEDTKLRHLQIATASSRNPGLHGISYNDAGDRLVPDFDPRTIFEKIYGPIGDSTDGADPAVARRMRLRTSILDSTIEEYRLLNATLSVADRRRLQEHLSTLRDQERRIQAAEAFSCEAPSPPDPCCAWSEDRQHHLARYMTPDHVALASRALVCGATRSAVVRTGMSTSAMDWLAIPESMHNISHGDTGSSNGGVPLEFAYEWHASARRWQVEQFKVVVDALANAPEPGGEGTMLDNTICMWIAEMGIEAVHHHRRDHMAALVVGGAGGALRTNQHFDAEGRHFDDFLLSLVHAGGCTDVTSFGDSGENPISEILSV